MTNADVKLIVTGVGVVVSLVKIIVQFENQIKRRAEKCTKS